MSDLISREAAVHVLCEENINRPLDSDRWLISDIYKKIEELPTIDAVPVVRCKDCKYKNVYRFPPKYDVRDYCVKHERSVDVADFCSWAERRTDAE